MKKILAGVLAAASMLTMTLGASAATSNDKPIKAAGEVEYDVSVTAPKVTLDLVLPAKIAAALNPYGADIVLGAGAAGDVATTAGIASVGYTITNNSVDYGVYLDATATTTTSSKDITVKKAVPTANTKEAQLVLAGANDMDGLKAIADAALPTANAATDGTDQGVLVMDSTVVADKTTGTAAGQTKQKKFMYLAAAADADNPVTAAMGFLGQLGTGDDIEWTEDDAINVSLILKVSAGGKNFAGGATNPGGFTADVAASDIGGISGAWALGALTANNTYAMTYDGNTGGNCTPTFTGYSITSATSSDTTKLTVNASGRMTGVADGTVTVTYVLENDTDNSDTPTIKFEVTLSNC